MILPRSPLPFQRVFLYQKFRVGRMHEHEHVEFLRLGPERIETRRRKRLAHHASADGRALESLLLHSVLQLSGGEVGMLQRHGSKAREAVGMRRAPFGHFCVLQRNNFLGQVAVRRIPPEAVDVQQLHVDAARVERVDALRPQHEISAASAAALALEESALQQVRDFRHLAVRVHVDDFRALAAHGNHTLRARRSACGLGRQGQGRCFRRRGVQQITTREHETGGCARNCPDEGPAICHVFPSPHKNDG